MKTLIALLLLLSPCFTFAGDFGFLQVVVLEVNPRHSTAVSLWINNTKAVSFSHSTNLPIVVDIYGGLLANGKSTKMKSDYGQLASDCEFSFKISYSMDKNSWIDLGTYKAPTNSVQTDLPIGFCDGVVCSSNSEIQKRIKEIEAARWKQAGQAVKDWLANAEKQQQQQYQTLKEKIAREKAAQKVKLNLDSEVQKISQETVEQESWKAPADETPSASTESQNLDSVIAQAMENSTVDQVIQRNAQDEKFLEGCLNGSVSTQYLCDKYGGMGWIGSAAEAIAIGLSTNSVEANQELENRILDPSTRESLTAAAEKRCEMRNRIQHVLEVKRSEAIWNKVANAARVGIAFSPLNDITDFCEAVTGRVMCLPSGEYLTGTQRFFAVVGIIAGNRMLWQEMTAEAKVILLGDKATAEYVEATLKIKIPTPQGFAQQELTKEAFLVRREVEEGGKLYRIGTKGRSQTGTTAQFWSPQHPFSEGFGKNYGIPEQNIKNIDFIESAIIKKDGVFVTRKAPGVGNNLGGAIEIVVPEGQVIIQSHTTL